MVIEAGDFDAFPVGGQLTTVRQLITVFGDRLALVGISTQTEPIGRWFKKAIGGVEYDFFSIGYVDPSIRKPRVPRRIDTLLRLKFHRKGILSLGLNAAFVIAPEVMLAIKGWGLRIAFLFPGVENPLNKPRYAIGKWLAQPYERCLFSALATRSELIMAAADQKAIQSMKNRSRGVLDHRAIIPSPTLVDTQIFNVHRVPVPVPAPALALAPGRAPGPELVPGFGPASGSGPVLVSCGRLNLVKGWDLMLDAFLQVRREAPAATLHFIGDGEDRAKLEKRISEADVAGSVFVTGFLEPRSVARILNTADVFLLGSHWEGWPTALVEALACGLPAVATDVSGVSSLIEPGRNGYIVQDRDAEDFARKIIAALNLECPNPTSLKIGGRHSLAGWKAKLCELWEPFRNA
jgi:glycosyltransferase involved in cell wall biosynthesis